jgi:hypothetical protein
MPSTLAVLICSASAIAFLGWMVYRLTSSGDSSAISLEWLEEFSSEKYSLMERLLYEGDYAFLSKQPGYSPSIAKRLRAERKRLFRDYVRQLNRDFNSLMTLAKLMVVYGDRDQSELASALWQRRVAFYRAIVTLEVRVALAPLGVAVPGVKDLVDSLGQLRSSVLAMVPAELMESSSATAA